MRQAFESGATMVQIAVQKTTEADGQADIVLFHDATLECRTNAKCSAGCTCVAEKCITGNQTLAYLKSLDIGYGYTADGGQTFPFRGRFIGAMPRLEEALDLLAQYPDKKILINQKDNSVETLKVIVKILKTYSAETLRRVFLPRDINVLDGELDQLGTQIGPSYKKAAESCLKQYILKGWMGIFPKECKNISFMVPTHMKKSGIPVTKLIWGWPDKFVERVHANNSKVYAFGINSREELDKIAGAEFDGIVSSKIETIGSDISNKP